jgi:2'-5' RNA ligase
VPARAFIALTLPDPTRDLLARACGAFRSGATAWDGEKWVAPELLHVTVKFVGALPDAAVAPALRALREEALRHPAFELAVLDVHAVPARRRASMLWARMAGETERCEMLASGIESVLEELLGVDRDARSFHPHVTLARARRPRTVPDAALLAASEVLTDPAALAATTMSVVCATLLSSTLGPAGPTYDTLGTIPLSSR